MKPLWPEIWLIPIRDHSELQFDFFCRPKKSFTLLWEETVGTTLWDVFCMIKTWKITEIECRNTLARPKIYNFETWICEYLYGEGSLDSQNCFCEADILDVVYRSIVHYKRYVCTRQIRHLYSVIDVLLFSDKLSNFESTQFWQCYDHEILPNNLILAIKSNENNLWKHIYNLYYGGTRSRKFLRRK